MLKQTTCRKVGCKRECNIKWGRHCKCSFSYWCSVSGSLLSNIRVGKGEKPKPDGKQDKHIQWEKQWTDAGETGHCPLLMGSEVVWGKSLTLLYLLWKELQPSPNCFLYKVDLRIKSNMWKHFENGKVLPKYQGLLNFLNPAIPLPSPLKEQRTCWHRMMFTVWKEE